MNIARSKLIEPAVWACALALFGALLAREGLANARLQAAVPLAPKELYQAISSSQQQLQIIDIREDLAEGYQDTHVPGSIPYPACDPAKAPPGAAERVLASVPTVVVSAQGDPAAFAACAQRFTQARNLAGGIAAWLDANLPEDSGEYLPPKSTAGGGCL